LPGPAPGQPTYPFGAAPVDGRLDDREDRALQRRRRQDLRPAAVLVERVGRLVLAGRELPDLLAHVPRDQPGTGPGDQPDRPVQQLLHPDLRCRVRRMISRTTRPATAAAIAIRAGAGSDATFSRCLPTWYATESTAPRARCLASSTASCARAFTSAL